MSQSYAFTHAATLPGREALSDATERPSPAFEHARQAGQPNHSAPEPRASDMVARDNPHPAPRPSPAWAGETDRAAFDAAWAQEAREANMTREARKHAFKASRTQDTTPTRERNFNRHAEDVGR